MYTVFLKWSLHVHCSKIIVLKLSWFQINNLCWFIVELLFCLTFIYLTSITEIRPVTMILLMQLVFIIHVAGYLSWKHGMFIIKVVWPFRQQLLESETAYCGICHKNCTSVVDFTLHHEWVHLCIPLFVCPVCHFTYITWSCLQMHITDFHGGLSSAQQSLSFNYNFKN